MGAFSLANLCHGGENRDVVEREEGRSLGPIQLACWKTMEPHGLNIDNCTRECGKKVLELVRMKLTSHWTTSYLILVRLGVEGWA